MKRMESLEKAIANRTCSIGVIGMGYVGLPMAALFADRGYNVTGADIKADQVRIVNSGKSPIKEPGMQDLVARVVASKKLRATTEGERVVGESDVVLIVVQTPLGEDKRPDLRALKSACAVVAKNVKGKLVVVESTIPPGATKELIVPVLESSGCKAGKDFHLAYSPERAMPSRMLEEITSNPRIIGGIDDASARLTKLLYSQVTSGEIILGDIATVEVVKVIENTYRDVNIALANEIALLCENLGVDATKAIGMANRHPRVHLLSPGPGVGGHCIPKDPYFALDSARKHGLELRVISSARKVNEAMPKHMLEMIEKALERTGKKLKNSKIAILGVTYKGNTNDIRGSPAKDIIQSLLPLAEIFSHDPLATQDFGGKFSNNIEEAVRGADCVVVVADHKEYAGLDLERLSKLVKKPGVIVDGRRILDPERAREKGFTYFGVGY